MVDDLRSRLKTKGFSDASVQTPLRDFWGVLAEIAAEEVTRTFDGNTRSSVVVTFKFMDVDVIQSTEPYEFPIANIPLTYSDRSGTRWSILMDSLNKMLDGKLDGLVVPGNNGKELVPHPLINGTRMHWKYTPDHSLYSGTENKRVPQAAWEVVELKGGAKTAVATDEDPNLTVLKVLHGKTDVEFNMQALRLDVVKKTPALQTMILQRQFIQWAMEQQYVTKDADNKYWLEEGVAAALGVA